MLNINGVVYSWCSLKWHKNQKVALQVTASNGVITQSVTNSLIVKSRKTREKIKSYVLALSERGRILSELSEHLPRLSATLRNLKW